MHTNIVAPAIATAMVVVVLGYAGMAPAGAAEVTLFKTQGCGCCEGYADVLRQNGYEVTVNPTHELVAMSRAAGIQDSMHGCHLSHVDGYVVSGHVPVGILNRLRAERPDIKGVTLPGMPQGSPGMSGRKAGPFTIYEIGGDQPKVYAVE